MSSTADPDEAEDVDTIVLRVREALNLSLSHALERDPRVFLIGEDIADPQGGSFKVTAGLSTRFGTDRVKRTPISETGIIGAAIGASLVGRRPVAEIMYMDFLAVAMDQIVNQAALMCFMSGGQLSVPIVIRTTAGARRSSAAQHSKSLEAWIYHIPGLKCVVLSSPNDAYWLLQWALEDTNPVIFFEPNILYGVKGELDLRKPPANLTKPDRIRTGGDATIATWGAMTPAVTEAVDILAEEGIEAEVLVLRQLAPLDCSEIVESASRTGLLAIVHEAWVTGGIGAEIAAQVGSEAYSDLRGPILRLGALHGPHPFAPVLEAALIPSVESIVESVRAWVRN